MCRLLVTASVVPTSPILVSLMKEALSSSETSVLIKPHGITSQKMPFFIVTAVKTSNLAVTVFHQTVHLQQNLRNVLSSVIQRRVTR
jgi:hypothetical protein